MARHERFCDPFPNRLLWRVRACEGAFSRIHFTNGRPNLVFRRAIPIHVRKCRSEKSGRRGTFELDLRPRHETW